MRGGRVQKLAVTTSDDDVCTLLSSKPQSRSEKCQDSPDRAEKRVAFYREPDKQLTYQEQTWPQAALMCGNTFVPVQQFNVSPMQFWRLLLALSMSQWYATHNSCVTHSSPSLPPSPHTPAVTINRRRREYFMFQHNHSKTELVIVFENKCLLKNTSRMSQPWL